MYIINLLTTWITKGISGFEMETRFMIRTLGLLLLLTQTPALAADFAWPGVRCTFQDWDAVEFVESLLPQEPTSALVLVFAANEMKGTWTEQAFGAARAISAPGVALLAKAKTSMGFRREDSGNFLKAVAVKTREAALRVGSAESALTILFEIPQNEAILKANGEASPAPLLTRARVLGKFNGSKLTESRSLVGYCYR